MKHIFISMLALLVFSMGIPTMGQNSFYDFTVDDIHGNEYRLAQLQGKKVLVVNTASKCGFTPQYEGLESLYRKYGGGDFVILGFPSNDFLRQEPGSNEEIAAFCTSKYEVSFPMMSKISVKGGDMHEVYHFLTEKEKNGLQDSEVSWNFQKYLLDEQGELVMVIKPSTLPTDPSIVKWIETN